MLLLQFGISSYTSPLYRQISYEIRSETNAYVHLKGSTFLLKETKRQKWTLQIYFAKVFVVPKSNKDVAEIIKICRRYQVSISVRSGGHSFLCQSINPGNKSDVAFFHWQHRTNCIYGFKS
jgi:hypothetical protein